MESIYHRALPWVYGYLLPRSGSTVIAEDLTSETFMAAVAASRQNDPPDVSIAWLIGIARHKLVDHWRRREREERRLADVAGVAEDRADPWGEHVDDTVLHEALSRLPAPQRSALTLRYLDGLPVAEVAAQIGRTLHGTETLLVRARAALRGAYKEANDDA